MAKENTSRPEKKGPVVPKANEAKKPLPLVPQAPEKVIPTSAKKSGNKGNRARIGGTAVPGAKSMQPKQIPTTNDPNEQQMASYNRDMRRRMQNMGTGPYKDEQKGKTPQERRKQTIERRKQRLEERRAQLRKSLPGGGISIGRRNTYFLIAVIVILVVLILIFLLLRFVWRLF